MNNHTSNGDDLYLRVLFPTVGRQGHAIHVQVDEAGTDQLHAREAALARDICRQLWARREDLREAAKPGEPRIRQLELPANPVRDVRATVCLDCPWVSWKSSNREHQHCLGAELQPPDGGGGGVPAVRITPDSVDLQAGEWGPYYDWVRPRRLMREGYGIVGSLNHAYRRASELWARREEIREATDPNEYLGQHKCVSLGDDPEDLTGPGITGCLTCTWIASAQYDASLQGIASEHEREAQQRDGAQFAAWADLTAHFGGEEGLAAAIAEACAYDHPWVAFVAGPDRRRLVLDGPHVPRTEPTISQIVPFPLSEAGLWRIVADLDTRLTRAVEELPLPHIDDDADNFRTALIDALVEELPALTDTEVLRSIGGGWTSCDDKINEPQLKHRRWFNLGNPAPLAVIGIVRRRTYIDRVAHAGPNTPTWKLDGTGIDVQTRGLVTGSDEDGPNFLRGVIGFSKQRLRVCRGCGQIRSDYLEHHYDLDVLCLDCVDDLIETGILDTLEENQ